MPSSSLSSTDIVIESLGGLGDGIANVNGKPLFIPKTCKGDRIKARIVEENQQALRGEIIEILTPGPDRVTPSCRYFDACGGCGLMQLSDTAYQAFKRYSFHSVLRQMDFPADQGEIIFLPPGTRRRVEFKVTPDRTLAFYRPRTNDLVAIDHCLVLKPGLQSLMPRLREMLATLPAGLTLKILKLTAADSGIDMLLYVTAWDKSFAADLRKVAENLGFWRVSIKLPDDSIRTIHEFAPVTMQLGDYTIPLPADAFLQPTREGQALLTNTILKAIRGKTVADLFCGIGTYSFPATAMAQVHAVESDASMVTGMVSAIKQHNLADRLSVLKRDLFKNPLSATELSRFDTVIINPPRIGAKKQGEQLAASKAANVVMVSCNPATWVRDAKTLRNAGFALESALGIDQFVFSPHFEIVSVFRR